MKNIKFLLAAISVTAAASLTTAVFAQQPALITVNLSNVANSIAKNLQLNASQIPAAVQTPVEVAASICHVGKKVLEEQGTSPNASCTAETTNGALEKIVREQLKVPLKK